MKWTWRIAIFCLCIVAVITLLYIYLLPEDSSPVLDETWLSATAFEDNIVPVSSIPSLHEKEVDELLDVSSLRGTAPNWPHVFMRNGQLVLNGHVVFYFDYFLTLEGELPIEKIIAIARFDMFDHYDEVVASALYEVFRRYWDYLNAVAKVSEEDLPDDFVLTESSVKTMEHKVRQAYFSTAEIQQLFGEYDDLLVNPSKASDIQRRLSEYRRVVDAAPDQLEAVATELFGEEAAQRLKALEIRRQQWQERLQEYQCRKDTILESEGLDDYARQESLQALLERSFSEAERLRIPPLERMGRIPLCGD